jgi:hypothetical protein
VRLGDADRRGAAHGCPDRFAGRRVECRHAAELAFRDEKSASGTRDADLASGGGKRERDSER